MGKVIVSTLSSKYTHPTTPGNKHIPAGGSAGQILRWSADGTATWGNDNNTDTHWTSKNIVGASGTATSNTTTPLTNNNVYLNHIENGAVTSTHKISGSGSTTVTTDKNGNIIVASTQRGIQNNLTSDSTTDSLSAAQGKVLKGLVDGKAASSHVHSPDQITDGYTSNPFYINTHPENSPVIIPFINNDIAFLTKRGGSAIVKYDNTAQSVDISTVFDGSGSYWAIDPSKITTITIELTLHKTFTWTNTIYVDNGANGWRAKNTKVEVINTAYSNDVWTTKANVTNYGRGQLKVTFTHTPSGASNAGGGFNKIRFTFSGWATSNNFRIACLGLINYGSSGIREICVPNDGGIMYGGITPYANNSYNIGSSDKKYANIYSTNFVGNAATATKATQDSAGQQINTTYIKGLSVSGRTITYTKGNGSTGTITTQDSSYTAGSGLTLSGSQFKHTNSITAGTAQGDASKTLTFGGTFTIPTVTYDAQGHITKSGTTTMTMPGNPNTDTDRYVNEAVFADDSANTAASPVKMTLTRAGSDTATVTANIPKVSSSSAGVVPKGAAVSSQSTSTKFLREDGTWAAPSYIANTDTKVTAVGNHYTPSADSSAALSASASGATAAWGIDVVKGITLNRDAKGHVTGVSVTSGKIPGNPDTDTKVTQTNTTTGNGYRLLFSNTADDTTRAEAARKSAKFIANPDSGVLSASGAVKSPKFATTNNKAILNEDAEGGNLRLTSPNNNFSVEMDLYNDTDFRMVFFNPDWSSVAIPFDFNWNTKLLTINGELNGNASSADKLVDLDVTGVSNFGYYGENRTEITATQANPKNLDNIISSGQYLVRNGDNSKWITNTAHAGSGYYLDVYKMSDTYVIQIAMTWAGVIKQRVITGGSWSDWIEICTTSKAQTFYGDKTFSNKIVASGATAVTTAQARNIYAGTSAMTSGTSALTTGTIYCQYE